KIIADDTYPDLTHLVPDQKRVILVSERRSGSQAVGRILNADPNVFYIGDPCRMGGGPEALAGAQCAAIVARLAACQPSMADVRNLFSFPFIVERSRALSEFEELREQGGGTPDENDELVRRWLARDCRLSKAVIIKEVRLSEIQPWLLGKDLGLRYLHVVRDPRAVLHALSESWPKSHSPDEKSWLQDFSKPAKG
ncbi:unnamed protein product, partial [Choristocarpus tenellus]